MSKLFKLAWQDLVRGAIVAALASSLTTLVQAIQTGPVDWKAIAVIALSTFVGYLVKNLATDEEGKILGKYQL